MLSFFRIRNLAIIEDVEVEFGEGMNIVTGDTGAGKSLLFRGLTFLFGAKLNADSIREGADRLEVEGVFSVPAKFADRVPEDREDLREAVSSGEILVRRSLDCAGRTRTSIGGKSATRDELELLSSLLIDITGQHQHGTLLDERSHRATLDRYGVPSEDLENVRTLFTCFIEARRRYEQFRDHAREKGEYFRRIAFEREELEKLAPRIGEKEELLSETQRLANSEVLAQIVQTAQEQLEGSEESIVPQLAKVGSALEQALKSDRQMTGGLELFRAAQIQLSELGIFLSEYASQLEGDPDRLENLRERVSEIARLERKYGKDEGALLTYFESIAAELAEFEGGAFDEEKLRGEVEARRKDLEQAEFVLRAARMTAARNLSQAVNSELKTVNLKNARFEVEVLPAESSANGADLVRFLLAANPGQPLRPLSAVASGGELSRILLILKAVLSDLLAPPVQVFDEIDTGIGGAVAQVVGERIKALAANSQVLLITHAPQIAALADKHIAVVKAVSGGRTRVAVRELTGDECTAEVARMLAGKKVSASFSDAARELVEGNTKRSPRSVRRPAAS